MSDAGSYTYNYLDPARHGEGTYAGPMAQELERAPGVVSQAADGTKMIDPARLTTVNTSAIAELNRKVDALAGIDSGLSEFETTGLGAEDEQRFQAWARQNNVTDVDHPVGFDCNRRVGHGSLRSSSCG